jgi:hypothetical protein
LKIIYELSFFGKVGLSGGITCGLSGGITCGLSGGITVGLSGGITVGLSGGITVGLSGSTTCNFSCPFLLQPMPLWLRKNQRFLGLLFFDPHLVLEKK